MKMRKIRIRKGVILTARQLRKCSKDDTSDLKVYWESIVHKISLMNKRIRDTKQLTDSNKRFKEELVTSAINLYSEYELSLDRQAALFMPNRHHRYY